MKSERFWTWSDEVHIHLVSCNLLLEKSNTHMHADMVTGGLGVRAELYNFPPHSQSSSFYTLNLLREGKPLCIWPPDLSLPLSQEIPTSCFTT